MSSNQKLYVQADGSLSTTVPRASWGYNPVDWVLAVFWMAVHCVAVFVGACCNVRPLCGDVWVEGQRGCCVPQGQRREAVYPARVQPSSSPAHPPPPPRQRRG